MRKWFRFFKERYRDGVIIDRTSIMTPEADLFKELISRWGLVAAIPDGEDSAGRSRLRLQTPEELVERAIRTTKLMMDIINKEGWIIDITPESTEEPTNE